MNSNSAVLYLHILFCWTRDTPSALAIRFFGHSFGPFFDCCF